MASGQRPKVRWRSKEVLHDHGRANVRRADQSNRMTIFGESAGGASVDLYAYAWTKDPILNGFIAQSGVAGMIPSVSLARSNWWNVSTKAGCGGKPAGNRTLDCMRELPALAIQKALLDTAGPALALTFFGPTEDGKIVFSDYSARRKAGNFIRRVGPPSYPL
jgi:cholinesterase